MITVWKRQDHGAPSEAHACLCTSTPLYLLRACADISALSRTFLGLGFLVEKEKVGWNSYKLEQRNDQNVNGDKAMNTDRVQAQFKRSHQSVNIHAISGITTRDGAESKTGDLQEIR